MFVRFPLMLNLLISLPYLSNATSTGIIAYVLFVSQCENVRGIAILWCYVTTVTFIF